MEYSLKFERIEINLEKLLKLLSENKNIQKYIYYLTNNPLLEVDVPIDLIDEGYILPTLYDGGTFEDEMVRVFINPVRGNLEGFTLGDIFYNLDIIVPRLKWSLKDIGKYRAYRIADEFSRMVDGQDVAGVGEVKIIGFNTTMVSNKQYFCLSLGIKVKSLTLKG